MFCKMNLRKKFEIKKNIIWKNRNKLNILITPHIGGSTADAWFSTQKRVIDKFLKECKKKKLYEKKKFLFVELMDIWVGLRQCIYPRKDIKLQL